jgi:very-short-patch-repair endonuclease
MSIARAKSLRSNATKSEQALWELLRRRQQWGLRFRRQHPIGPFVVDFVCLERRLIVEVDGAVHEHPSRVVKDIARDAWLSDQRFKIVRIHADIVMHDPERAIALIAAALGPATVDGVHTPHPRPFPRTGGRECASSQSLAVSKEQTS